MISDPRSFRRALMRSVSYHETERHASDGGSGAPRSVASKDLGGSGLSTSWADGSLEHALRCVKMDNLERKTDAAARTRDREDSTDVDSDSEDEVPASGKQQSGGVTDGVYPDYRCNGKLLHAESESSTLHRCTIIDQLQSAMVLDAAEDGVHLNGSIEPANERTKKNTLSEWRNKAA